MCFFPGDHVLTKDDVKVAECHTDLHVKQGDECIDTKGTECAKKQKGKTFIAQARKSRLDLFNIEESPLEPLGADVIKHALDYNIGNKKMSFNGAGGLTIIQTADNGVAMPNRGLEFYNDENPGC